MAERSFAARGASPHDRAGAALPPRRKPDLFARFAIIPPALPVAIPRADSEGDLAIRPMRFLSPPAGLALAAALTAAGSAAAHPHVWIDSRSAVLFDDNGAMVGVRHQWTFDEMFSEYATLGLETDADGALTREALAPLAEVNVESLHEFDYFTFLDLGDGDLGAFTDPVDYWLDHDGERLTLHFTLPLETPLMMDARRVSIEVFDPSFFVDFALAEDDPARLVDAPGHCRARVEEAEPLDPEVESELAEIPAEMDVPSDLFSYTADNPNLIHVICE